MYLCNVINGGHKNKDMRKVKDLLSEYESLIGSDKPEDEKRKEEIVKLLESTDSPEQRKMVDEMAKHSIEQIGEDLQEIEQEVLRGKIDERIYRLTPWGYIAKEYFGKSAAWLSQRINGTPVRGQVYTLNEEQKQTLNRAMREVGKLIGSFRFA